MILHSEFKVNRTDLGVDDSLNTAAYNLDASFVLSVIESLELPFFLPVIDGSNKRL
jgi:hypothetical protein